MVLRMVWLKIWNLMLLAMAIWFPLVIFVQVPCIVWVRCGEEASWWPWKGTRLNAYKVAQVTDKSNSCVHINVRSRSFYLIFVHCLQDVAHADLQRSPHKASAFKQFIHIVTIRSWTPLAVPDTMKTFTLLFLSWVHLHCFSFYQMSV